MGTERREEERSGRAGHDHDACHARIAELERTVAQLLAEVRELRARLGLNSTNSGRPPSSDRPSAPPRPRKPPTGRRPGGQPGHEGSARVLLPPEKVDRTVKLAPSHCCACKRKLPTAAGPRDPAPVRHQVTELPPVVAEVTEFQLEARTCSCGEVTRASLPADVPSGAVGPRLQAVAALLTGRYHLSRRDAEEALAVLFGAKVSLGTVVNLEEATARALLEPYQEVLAAVRSAPVAHADETGWRERGKRRWLWIAVTALHALFRVDPHRSREAFERLLGHYKGTLVTDRWSSYSHLPLRRREICWAHLKRDFQKLVDRGGAAVEVGQAALGVVKDIFETWHAFKRGSFDRPGLVRRFAPIKKRLRDVLEGGQTNGDHKASALCRELLKLWRALWTFVRVEGVEPTNNDAERPLRSAVLWRKGSFGCHSEGGARFVERILTTVATLRKQGRAVLDFLETAIRARLVGDPPPSLLPIPAPSG